jgi:hypothetical protein
MQPGDLLRIRGSRVLWSDDDDARIMGDERLPDGELVVFVGRAKYKFIRVLHPLLGLRQIHRSHAVPVQGVDHHGILAS